MFRQPELADTLKRVAAEGASYMYGGPWGRKFSTYPQRRKITVRDMENYRAFWEEPVTSSYHKYKVFRPGISAWGGVDIVEGLNLLELADLKQSGHYSSSPCEPIMVRRNCGLSESDLELCAHIAGYDLSPASRVKKETSAWIWEQMQAGKWPYLASSMKRTATGSHSDGVVVVDQWGNVVALGHTINTVIWGDTGLFVDGVSIPDSASFQADVIADAGPGNRLANGMNPLIIVHGDLPVLASASVGGGAHQKTLQVLSNILDFGMDPQTAVDTPAFLLNGWNSSAVVGQVEKRTFAPKVLAGAQKLGLTINTVDAETLGMALGYWTGIKIDPATRQMQGGVSRSLPGEIVAY